MATQILTPVGRIVWGHPGKSQVKKDQKTKQPILRDGKPVEQWAFGVAFPKDVFNAQVWPQLHAEASTVYPQGFPPTFSWKFKDGDSIDRAGKPYSAREGYAGHFVLTISTEAFAPPMFKFENGAYRQITAEEIKCGDYIVLNLNAKANKPIDVSHTPGIYINPNGIELVGYGQEIVSAGADPDALFGAGGHQRALPPGASLTPVSSAPTGAAMPATPTPALPAGAPAMAMPTTFAAPAAPVAAAPLPAPAHDFVHAAAGVPPAMPPVPAAPAAPVAFPPAGWLAHPQAPGFYYSGQEVLAEAALRAKFAVPGMPAPR
jgi:hypothetical protein